ncbi:apolipoprotein N-acyltransferase [Microbacterium sp. STN6]|uniref:apolipoprotein N-acyltransferase n=1 Tax=Microbacterium sp. STN6 TaxID=2995588 RepID=UPI0022609970|nr:apolipoprotein N-acyltransferase [Microbacterium sp. STN6]MCX7521559.1 apolipoprotein N-acyltransferase [Microbacterium sp. STN6]
MALTSEREAASVAGTPALTGRLELTARRAPLPLWLALIVAAAAGPVYDGGFPSLGWWPLAFVGIGMFLLSLIGRRAGSSFLVGLVGGLSFYLVHIQWASLYLGDIPWFALATVEALFFAVGAVLITLAYRWVPRAWPSRAGRLGMVPLVVAGLWTAREGIANVWPYGGFAWGRAALSQSQSPFASLAAWLGLAGLTFVMVLFVAFVLACFTEQRMSALAALALAVAAACCLLVVPAWPVTTSGTVRIAAVQGNGKAGYFDKRQPGDVLASQAGATLPLVGQRVDMVVWPEGGSDLDPTRDEQAASVLNYLSAAMSAPIVTGTVTERGGKYYNTSIVWEAGKGVVASYDKRHPVPFGEYIPDRAFWRPFAPDLIDLVQRGYTPGTRPNVVWVGPVRAGISICFDIADDQLLTDMMKDRAQVILAQTNNADFGHTDENVQQLAIARLRAIESGRSLVNISTVGTSSVIGPDGRTLDSIPAYKPAAMVTSVPIGTATTPASLLSRGIEYLACGLGLAGLLIGALARRRR